MVSKAQSSAFHVLAKLTCISQALITGSNLILSPEVSISESNMLFLSPDSQCASFTSRANGYGRGEGVVAIIVKRVADALADGDIIRAVIRGAGSNQDGRTPGIGRPSPVSQEALIRRVYRDAALDLDKTRYFEAHGKTLQFPILNVAVKRLKRC
jgi:acyl transferase domain-containing protein